MWLTYYLLDFCLVLMYLDFMNTTMQRENKMTENGFQLSEDNHNFFYTVWEKTTADGETLVLHDVLTGYFDVHFTTSIDADAVTLRHQSIPSLSNALKSAANMAHQSRTNRNSHSR